MITKSKWISILTDLAHEMEKKGTIYKWKSPVNEANSMKYATCVSFVGLALQRAGYLPANTYINFQDTGNLHGPGASYIRKHPELFTLIENVNKSPQNAGLQIGDIVAYKSHIMVFAGWSGKIPLWYSLERNGSNGYGKKPRLDIREKFSFYNTRVINGGIVRLKFKAEDNNKTDLKPQPKPTTKPASTTVKGPKYKTLTSMNIRQSPTTNSKRIGTLPHGTIFVAAKVSESGYWAYMTHANLKGWVCIAPKYCKKV